MFKKRKKEQESEEMNESWLLPYSDLMTLLLAVFIVLYAVSHVDEVKLKAMSQAFRSIFEGGAGVFEGTSDEFEPFDTLIVPTSDPEATNNPTETTGPTSNPNESDEARREQMEALKKSITEYFKEKDMSDEFNVRSMSNALLLTLDSDVLFPSGSSELSHEEKNIAKELADVLNTQDYAFRIWVSGHTDNVPIHTPKYSSNWKLSLDRAVSFTTAMLEGSQLDPRIFSATGHGDLDPVASNDTSKGRAKNRRVEIWIIY